jgi:hypothetical protein
MVTRAERYRQVRELRDKGLLQSVIADQLGVSRSYVSDLLADPDGSKQRARRDLYSQPCPECGEPMDGSNGLGQDAPGRCKKCSNARGPDYWTQERIIEAFQGFFVEFGRSPTATEITARSPSGSVTLSATRKAEVEQARWFVLPHPETVRKMFGSWAKGLAGARLPASATGGAAHREGHGSSDHYVRRHGQLSTSRRVRRSRAMPRVWRVMVREGTDGQLREVATVEAATGEIAMEEVANESGGAGTYVAVQESQWVEHRLGSVEKFAVVREDTAA